MSIVDIKLGTERRHNGKWLPEREGQYRPEITEDNYGEKIINTYGNGGVWVGCGIWKLFTREYSREHFKIDKPCALGGWDGTGTEKTHIYEFRRQEGDGKFHGYPIKRLDDIAKEEYKKIKYKDQI